MLVFENFQCASNVFRFSAWLSKDKICFENIR